MAGYKKRMKPNTNCGLLKIFILLAALAVVLVWQDNPAQAQDLTFDLTEMSVEELMNIEVTSVSKKEEKLFKSAAAVYVITQEDIRRSGVTSIPEALRMVPGMHVAQINASKWAISSRGFNQIIANKLLVLIDGRSVYTPLFSGVYWDVQDTMLEDIDRIEIIRGPGATLWGANAVNGVINIITKSAKDTQGGLITAGSGTEERGFGGIRYGGKLGEDAYYRLYVKYFDRDGFMDNAGNDTADDWDVLRGGFRVDWYVSDTDSLTFQGDIYGGDAGETLALPSLMPPYALLLNEEAEVNGGNLLARWNRIFSETSDMLLQIYYDQINRKQYTINEIRDTFDVDFQHRFALSSRQEIVWGLGYRFTTDDIDNSFPTSLDPESREDGLYSVFVQDEIKIVEDKLRITIGSKFEHNDYTGSEVQPSARLLWTPRERHTLWAAVSRAVQTPSRSHHDMRINHAAFPGDDGLVSLLSLFGDPECGSEELVAYELGYRVQPADRLALDIVTFYNDYDNLRTFEPGTPFMEVNPPPPHLVIPSHADNKMEGEAYGAEVSAYWNPMDCWKLATGYTYFRIRLDPDASSRDRTAKGREGNNPRHQFHVRSYYDLTRNLEFDVALYYVDDLSFVLGPVISEDIASYTRLDVRLNWSPTEDLQLSVGFQNLLDERHQEFGTNMGVEPTEIERSIYGKITWQF